MAKAKLEFISDVQDHLSPALLLAFQDVKAKYNAHKDAAKALPSYAAHKSAQAAFEQAVTDAFDCPEGHALVFGYNYGKLSIAVKPVAKAKAKVEKGKLDLSAWIAQRANAGLSN